MSRLVKTRRINPIWLATATKSEPAIVLDDGHVQIGPSLGVACPQVFDVKLEDVVGFAYLLAVLVRVAFFAQRHGLVLVDDDAGRRVAHRESYFVGGLAALQGRIKACVNEK